MSSSFDVFKLTDDDTMNFWHSHHQHSQHVGETVVRRPCHRGHPSDVVVVSAQPYAQRSVLKFAVHICATPIVGRFTPGSLTNQIQKNFKQRFVAFFEKERGVDMHASIKRRKFYINTVYQALRNAYAIDEKGTCAVYDTNAFAADDFYDALDFG
ncbi:hypothetical protein niasHT_024971 [Heterodera trifolii]|uniref:Uncharacterized protein n=1 Tax=Heterodera trifolii TaxID=157864 RepID=A0ABD2JAS2_9BILA